MANVFSHKFNDFDFGMECDYRIPYQEVPESWGVKKLASQEEILEQIIFAQASSDGGKGIERFNYPNSEMEFPWWRGYAGKDKYILNAIVGIEELEESEVTWYVASDFKLYRHEWTHGDIFGDPVTEVEIQMDSIIYFEWNGYQISFHSFNPIWREVIRKYGHRRPIQWDEEDSAWSCFCMIKYLSMFKETWKDINLNMLRLRLELLTERRESMCLTPISGVCARGLAPEVGVKKRYMLASIYDDREDKLRSMVVVDDCYCYYKVNSPFGKTLNCSK